MVLVQKEESEGAGGGRERGRGRNMAEINTMSLQDGSAGPEFKPQDPCGGRRALTPAKLPSDLPVCTVVPMLPPQVKKS